MIGKREKKKSLKRASKNLRKYLTFMTNVIQIGILEWIDGLKNRTILQNDRNSVNNFMDLLIELI